MTTVYVHQINNGNKHNKCKKTLLKLNIVIIKNLFKSNGTEYERTLLSAVHVRSYARMFK